MRRLGLLAVAAGVALAGCDARLPEPESEGALLYAHRCGSCHRLYAPGSLKYEMWKFQVDRKQADQGRRGRVPLSKRERTVLLDYLRRHAG